MSQLYRHNFGTMSRRARAVKIFLKIYNLELTSVRRRLSSRNGQGYADRLCTERSNSRKINFFKPSLCKLFERIVSGDEETRRTGRKCDNVGYGNLGLLLSSVGLAVALCQVSNNNKGECRRKFERRERLTRYS